MPEGPEARSTEETEGGADATNVALRSKRAEARARREAISRSCVANVSSGDEAQSASTQAQSSASKKSETAAKDSAWEAARTACSTGPPP